MWDVIGVIAGLCTTAAFLPQALKCWRSRSTGDISLTMFLVFAIGVCLWLGYGIAKGDLPLIPANGTTLLLVLSILWMKVRYG